MKRALKKGNLYSYLDASKVLESNNEALIAAARKQYWLDYRKKWRQQRRKDKKELLTEWSSEELRLLTECARKNKRSRSKFIHVATLAYINKVYVVPDQVEVRRIAQMLAMTYNLIKEMKVNVESKTIDVLLEHVFELERNVNISLNHPKTLEQWVTDTVKANPAYRETLIELLKRI